MLVSLHDAALGDVGTLIDGFVRFDVTDTGDGQRLAGRGHLLEQPGTVVLSFLVVVTELADYLSRCDCHCLLDFS